MLDGGCLTMVYGVGCYTEFRRGLGDNAVRSQNFVCFPMTFVMQGKELEETVETGFKTMTAVSFLVMHLCSMVPTPHRL